MSVGREEHWSDQDHAVASTLWQQYSSLSNFYLLPTETSLLHIHRKNITPILSKVAGQAWNQDHIINTNQNSQELCMSILLQLYSLN